MILMKLKVNIMSTYKYCIEQQYFYIVKEYMYVYMAIPYETN